MALLHLIQLDEPFGLSVVEAMATGTPVIAFRRGSMPELIDDGVSGSLIAPHDSDGVAAAVERIGELDRKAARAHVERHFTAGRMVDDYLQLYRRLLGQDQLRRPRPSGGRCDACHARRSHAQRSRDGLVTVCGRCARGVDVTTSDAREVIAAVASRAPATKRQVLTRRLLARLTVHQARRTRHDEISCHAGSRVSYSRLTQTL